MTKPFAARLTEAVARYRAEIAGPREHLSLLRWQIDQGHALDSRDTFPGHVTTSAYVLSPDHARILLIDHVVIGRWLQPGGHWEEAESFHASAAREALEETGVQGLRLHPWHEGSDAPFVIDSHDVPCPSRPAISLPGRSGGPARRPDRGGPRRRLEAAGRARRHRPAGPRADPQPDAAGVRAAASQPR